MLMLTLYIRLAHGQHVALNSVMLPVETLIMGKDLSPLLLPGVAAEI